MVKGGVVTGEFVAKGVVVKEGVVKGRGMVKGCVVDTPET